MNRAKCVMFIALLLLPAFAAAQDQATPERGWNPKPRLEVTTSIAMGYVFRYDDEGFGKHPNLGIGIEMPVWRKLRIGGEINRTFGFSLTPLKPDAILFAPGQPMPYVGTARSGVSSATAGSITASYFFGDGRVQPYLLGGIGILSATEHRTISKIQKDYVAVSEFEVSSTGIGPAMGVGLRASVNRHFSIRPEIRFCDGTARSGLNLSQWRLSLGVAYGW